MGPHGWNRGASAHQGLLLLWCSLPIQDRVNMTGLGHTGTVLTPNPLTKHHPHSMSLPMAHLHPMACPLAHGRMVQTWEGSVLHASARSTTRMCHTTLRNVGSQEISTPRPFGFCRLGIFSLFSPHFSPACCLSQLMFVAQLATAAPRCRGNAPDITQCTRPNMLTPHIPGGPMAKPWLDRVPEQPGLARSCYLPLAQDKHPQPSLGDTREPAGILVLLLVTASGLA